MCHSSVWVYTARYSVEREREREEEVIALQLHSNVIHIFPLHRVCVCVCVCVRLFEKMFDRLNENNRETKKKF